MDFIKKTKKIRKYWVEIILIILAIIIAAISGFVYVLDMNESKNSENGDISIQQKPAQNKKKIYAYISGSVKRSGLYEASNDFRVKNLIERAGGLTDAADKDYLERNFNLAERVYDQQKVYIPSVWEVSNGYSIESQPPRVLGGASDFVSINEATLEELDTLPGVGKVTAQKIIDNRPYGALEELIDKKIFGEKSFKNIEKLIGI